LEIQLGEQLGTSLDPSWPRLEILFLLHLMQFSISLEHKEWRDRQIELPVPVNNAIGEGKGDRAFINLAGHLRSARSSVRRSEDRLFLVWKQTDGQTDGGDCITSHANAVGNYDTETIAQ